MTIDKHVELDDFSVITRCPKCCEHSTSTSTNQFTMRFVDAYGPDDDRRATYGLPDAFGPRHITVNGLSPEITGIIVHTCVSCGYVTVTRTADERAPKRPVYCDECGKHKNFHLPTCSKLDVAKLGREAIDRGAYETYKIDAARWRKIKLVIDDDASLKTAMTRIIGTRVGSESRDLVKLVDAMTHPVWDKQRETDDALARLKNDVRYRKLLWLFANEHDVRDQVRARLVRVTANTTFPAPSLNELIDGISDARTRSEL